MLLGYTVNLYAAVADTIKSAGWLLLKITSYMIPLMIFLEFAKYSQWLKKFSHYIYQHIRNLGMSEGAVFSFLIGIIFGLTFEGGIIIQESRHGTLTEKDRNRLTTFLNICHAHPEDTSLFAAIRASIPLILIPRFLCAFFVTYLEEKCHLRKKINSSNM